MISAGIDVGAQTTKAVIMGDGRILACSNLVPTGFDPKEAAEQALKAALQSSGLASLSGAKVMATGSGARSVGSAQGEVTVVKAAARAAIFFFPTARTVIDVGAEETRAILCNQHGRVLDFALNEKCAAGTGAFLEAMSRALEIPIQEMGAHALRSSHPVTMSSQCTVFSESEVISLIHSKAPRDDIVRGLHDAIAGRVASLARRVGVKPDAVLMGGMARNPGFVQALQRMLDCPLLIPDAPEFAAAAGAALLAASRSQ